MNMQNEIPKMAGLGTLERPLYSPGLLLEDEDLTSAVDYTRRLTQLMFSSLFGCGVICGLRIISAEKQCNGSLLKVVVSKGLGLDCFGNPIEVPSDQTVTYDPKCKDFPPEIWVTACYVERHCAPRELSCAYDGGNERAFTRHRAGFEIKLYGRRPDCACSCAKPEAPPTHDHGDCCSSAGESARAASAANPENGDWDCYADHMNGVCSCGRGCNCIVIGKIDLSAEQDGALETALEFSDRSMVRQIRPVLMGQWHNRSVSRQSDHNPGEAATVRPA
ncbi:hypothetical protein OIU34_07390 [Pararhizobium sp. BT-229]|uniref:hypothetical protein n=1 Tax=Pararhizobium sp. BT-229 TaxID=2986923 RepID=UPI0021F743F0|nr:hypothetical protein [Pararhizobium sp. BT-229]MCV9961724.1 hypothetical protein [Pararhizobium sp. BT-229]